MTIIKHNIHSNVNFIINLKKPLFKKVVFLAVRFIKSNTFKKKFETLDIGFIPNNKYFNYFYI